MGENGISPSSWRVGAVNGGGVTSTVPTCAKQTPAERPHCCRSPLRVQQLQRLWGGPSLPCTKRITAELAPREWQTIPVFLPGEFHGQKPGKLQSMRSLRVGHNWATNTYILLTREWEEMTKIRKVKQDSLQPVWSPWHSHTPFHICETNQNQHSKNLQNWTTVWNAICVSEWSLGGRQAKQTNSTAKDN